ncbi:cytochrome P450 [Cercophora newfieldiana]|uniref:Cytochrome P450 n=1 Tax=Cercophora newfieldiana TaxID=92897 RepID=A0AA40CS84_9PEZI|nr:cytochrome P450 [Cercophora newfieldiana]
MGTLFGLGLAAQLGALLAIVLVTRSIYRLYFSPLAKFPGPKLAALTSLYEGYYDCFKEGGGRYHVEINRMHDKYGPIIRINPWELHIRDPDWNEVYKITRRAYKPLCHRMRREAINSYFSPSAVAKYQPVVEELVRKLIHRLAEFKDTGEAVRLDDAFRALATDGATAFAFRRPFGHLDSPDFEHVGNRGVRMLGYLGALNRITKGFVLWALRSLMPAWVALGINPGSLGVQGFYKGEAAADLGHQILNSNLPAEEKTLNLIKRESSAVALAGTESTGSTITVTAYCLLSQPEKAARLRTELKQAYENCGRPPTYQELKELPYLVRRLVASWCVQAANMMYRGLVIPKGTYVSTTQNDTHFCADIFPDPHTFCPERWLDGADRKRLSKYLVPFGRGARSCIGMDIALTEIYLCLTRLFSPEAGFRLELHDTDYDMDVHFYHDFFSPFPKSKKGIKAFIK